MAFKFTSEHVVGKGENKRCVVAVFEHLQFCERNVKRSALKYPWRMGFLSDRIVCHCHLGLLAWLHCMCLQLQMAVVKTFFKLRIQAFLHSVQTVVLQNAKS